MKNRYLTLISTICVLSLLSGCSKATDKADKTDSSKSSGLASSLDSGTKPAEKASTESGTAAGTTPDTSSAAPAAGTTASNAAVPKSVKIDLNQLPADVVICTVAGDPIKVGDYRRMLKLREIQLQNQIAVDPVLRASLLQQAQQQKLSLTADEKSKLLKAAEAQHPDLQNWLKERNMTQADFEKEVSDAGLIYKAGSTAIEQGLLAELVQRQLLSKASLQAGLQKKAMDKYLLVKTTKNFKDLKDQSGLGQDDLRDELVKGELASYEVEKIAKGIHVSDAEIRDAYNKNKNQLTHNERIRLATILVSAPEQDLPGIPSVRNQVRAANPKLDGKELDATVAQVMQAQQNKALVLLGEAKSTKDFAKLANDNTDDIQCKVSHNGGDMGWQEKSQLVPQFVDAVWDLKPGTILPKLVKTGEGYRIVKVVGHEKSGVVSLSEVHDLLEAKIKQEKLQQAVNNWIAQQQQHVKIEFSPRFLAQANGGNTK